MNCPSGASRRARLLPLTILRAWRQRGILPSRFVVVVELSSQSMSVYAKSVAPDKDAWLPSYSLIKRCRISSSRFGIGQEAGSNMTPLGLHRIADKIGGGQPIGAVFKSRRPIGLAWLGIPDAHIAHRILWLDGLEPGFNRGGHVDSCARYIYLHGVGDETTLGKPASRGCIHLAADDLLPLFDLLPIGTLVYITCL